MKIALYLLLIVLGYVYYAYPQLYNQYIEMRYIALAALAGAVVLIVVPAAVSLLAGVLRWVVIVAVVVALIGLASVMINNAEIPPLQSVVAGWKSQIPNK